VLLDFMNTLDFDGADDLFPYAVQAARRTARLKERASAARVPVIYANDHFGNWHADFDAVVRKVEESDRGHALSALLCPEARDISILKPRHSAFYGTPLDFLLDELKVGRLILTGLAADNCVLFTAHDAYLRKFQLWVPRDCVASESSRDHARAIYHMQKVLKADTRVAARGRL
jgi:nicotinamidase-related amidase